MAYDIGWTPIVELQDGQTVSDKLDAVFININLGFDGLEIAEQNIIDLQTLTNDHETRIDALEGATPNFSYTSEPSFNVTNEVFDDTVGTTHIFSSPIGINMYGYSITFSGLLNDKLYIEMTVPNIDGTAGTPFVHTFEIKDSAEVRPNTYFFPRTHTGAITDGEVKLRFRIGSGDAPIDVNFIDVMSEIKG